MNTIEFNVTTATGNDIVQVRISATDDLSGVQDYIQCNLYNPDNNDIGTVGVYYNPVSGFHEGEFTINEYWSMGDYYIGVVYLYDNAGNGGGLYNNTDYSTPIVTILGTTEDIVPPTLISIDFNEINPSLNSILTILISADDDLSGIKSIQCQIYGPDNDLSATVNILFNESTGLYEGYLSISESWAAGDYVVQKITMIDNAGNQIVLENENDYTSPVFHIDEEGNASFNIPGYSLVSFLIFLGLSSFLISKKQTL